MNHPSAPVLVWLRRDLRLQDHAALAAALATGRQVALVFVFDRDILDPLPARDRRVEFIHQAVTDIDTRLRAMGGALHVRHDRPVEAIARWVGELGADQVFAARDYEPQAIARDDAVADSLRAFDARLTLVNDHTLHEPGSLLTDAGKPYSVFTPFKRRFLSTMPTSAWAERVIDPQELTQQLYRSSKAPPALPSLEDLGFEPSNLSSLGIEGTAEAGARLLEDFDDRIAQYDKTRDFPGVRGPSYLSVHLRFGTVSIRQAARMAQAAIGNPDKPRPGPATWLSELIWRDFYFQILYHYPHVTGASFKPAYDRIQWRDDDERFDAWCEGRTGYPLVDAAMAQINQTGYMHNRLRMVTASFLVKDLGINWQQGEAWFAEKLNDFDLAANNGGWQWAASSGCDAQPWFRIFNPVTQSQKFDPQGRFIRRYLPALAGLSDKEIHSPWLLGPTALEARGVVLGRDYPPPIVDHAVARTETLARYSVVK